MIHITFHINARHSVQIKEGQQLEWVVVEIQFDSFNIGAARKEWAYVSLGIVIRDVETIKRGVGRGCDLHNFFEPTE